jgi:hypothetical protein
MIILAGHHQGHHSTLVITAMIITNMFIADMFVIQQSSPSLPSLPNDR